MYKNCLIFLFITILFINKVYPITFNLINLKKSKNRSPNAAYTFLTNGPTRPIEIKNKKPINLDTYKETEYRVGFLVDEIYFSLSIDQIGREDLQEEKLVGLT